MANRCEDAPCCGCCDTITTTGCPDCDGDGCPTCDPFPGEGEDCACGDGDDTVDESMDGDHESALASAGWGTDEDYGCFGGCDDYGGDY